MTGKDAGARLRATLREIREELVRIDSHLSRYADATDNERQAVWSSVKTVIDSDIADVDRRLAQVDALLESHDRLANAHSDAITRIDHLWRDITDAWRSTPDTPPSVSALRRDLDRCVLEIAYLTLPDRLNTHLRSVRVGAAIDFHDEFADEIPNPATRERLLEWLHRHPRLVDGVVDPPSGTIMRASRRPARRAASWAMVLAVIVTAVGSAGFAPTLLPLIGVGTIPQADGAAYVWAMVFAYTGAVLHIGIAALKQHRRAQAGVDQRFTALGNFTIWVHINEMTLMLYALAIPVVAYVVMLSTGRIDNVTMAFVGFSIDSLLDVVLTRFDNVATQRVKAVRAAVS